MDSEVFKNMDQRVNIDIDIDPSGPWIGTFETDWDPNRGKI